MMSREEIDKVCREFNIRDYTINEDGTVDVHHDISNHYHGLEELPLNFGVVDGNFSCHNNELTTLKGSPHTVHGDFICSYNNLTSLEGGPKIVGGGYACKENYITNLIGSPEKVGRGFECSDNYLTSLEGCCEDIKGALIIKYTKVKNLDGFNSKIGLKMITYGSPIGSIFNNVDQDFLKAFKVYKVIKDDQVNLKRLKYVMGIFDMPIDLKEIQYHYKIV